MNDQITENSGNLLGKIESFEHEMAPSRSAKDPGRLGFRKWVKGLLSIRVGESEYKQVSAKGYRLK